MHCHCALFYCALPLRFAAGGAAARVGKCRSREVAWLLGGLAAALGVLGMHYATYRADLAAGAGPFPDMLAYMRAKSAVGYTVSKTA